MPDGAVRRCILTWLGRLSLSFFLGLGLIPAARAQHMVALPADQPGPASKLTLEDCTRVGLERQPALAAQQASLAAAQAQRRALDNLVCAGLFSRELPIRKQQASCGIIIAEAGLLQAEWETTYSITRCYYTLVYARKQEKLVSDLIQILDDNRKIAKALVDKGDPNVKITKEDVDKLAINIDLLQLRLLEASSGVDRATAALKEAAGLRYDAPLGLVLEDLPPIGDKVDREQVIALALARRGELVQAYHAARVAELEVSAQNTGCLLPFKKTFASAADIHSRPIPQGMTNGFYRPGAISLEMPGTLVGHKSDRVERAQEFSSRAAAVVEKTQNLIVLETEDAFYKWQAAAGQVKALEQSVSKTVKLRELLAQRWQDSKVTTEDYLRALALQDQIRSQLNEALFHHALGLAALERVTAGGFVPGFRRSAVQQK
jgi:outer membrane protein TolC